MRDLRLSGQGALRPVDGPQKSGAPVGAPPEEFPLGEPYIMPPMPPAGMAGASSSGSATTTLVVTMSEPMEAAF